MQISIKSNITRLAGTWLSLALLHYGSAAAAEAVSGRAGKSHVEVLPGSEKRTLSTIPRGFIPNVGQSPNEAVKFTLRDGGGAAYFTDQGFVLWNGQTATISRDGAEVKVPVAPRWTLVGGNPVDPIGGETFAHTVSFFLGNDPSKWHANVPAFRDLRYPEILSGVELRVASRERGFEYSFHVQPRARPDLRFRYDGITALEKSPAGDLIVSTAKGHFTESRPVSFQWIDGAKRDVASSFEVVSANEYRIAVGAYDERHELVIDPVLDWSTSIGGSFGEQFNVVKVDGAGEVVVAGWSWSADLPVTPGFVPFGTAPGDNLGTDPFWPEYTDVYIAKFSADGTQLRWAGYLGGNGEGIDVVGRNKALAVDAAGDLYVAAYTRSPDFPVLPTGSSAFSGNSDASITKIKSDGSAVLWSRLLGGADEDWGYALALDQNQSVYLSGTTRSPNFPATLRAFGGIQDAFMARLDAGNGAVLWSSFLGGSQEERVAAIVADANGVIAFGDTDSADFHASGFPAPLGEHDRVLGGANDAFITKISADGLSIQWSTFLGGSRAETGHPAPNTTFNTTFGRADIALDSAGNIVVVGQTYSSDFPATASGFQTQRAGDNDAFVAKLSPDASDLIWASYLGGSGQADSDGREEIAAAVAVNPWDEILIAGWTLSPSPTFPITPGALKGTLQADGYFDGFLTKVNSSGTAILYSTYIGNDGWNDPVLGLEHDAFGNILLCGWHYDTFFQITQGAFQQNCNNCGAETFLMKFLDAFLAHDGFESAPSSFPNSGAGDWAGAWTASGDYSILTSSGPHSGTRHARLRSSTGYLQRTVNLPPASLTVRLGFWGKVSSFEGTDQAVVLARSSGASFTPVGQPFTSGDSDNQYHYYEIDLTSFLPASQLHIAFDAAMNASNDNWYLDDIRLTGTTGSAPPVANAGPDQTVTDADNTGAETVALNGSASFDPDGGSIVAYEWKEGATVLGTTASINLSLAVGPHAITLTVTDDEAVTSTDTVQITVNPYVPPIDVFNDGFDVGEWNGLWTEDSQNDWFRSTQRKTNGSSSAEVDGSASDASLTSIAINLQGRSNATITFDWLIESGLDTGEYLEFRVSTNGGSTWTRKAILRGNVDPENSWRNVTVELPGISQLKLQFRGKMDNSDEDANVDKVRVVAH